MLLEFLTLANIASASCLHGILKAKSAEGRVEVSTFGYGPLNGPFNWASLAPENQACRLGRNQSPINIDDTISAAVDRPIIDIPEQSVDFENLGTTLEVIMNGTTTFNGTGFRLVQFHMHTPSEHHIRDEFYPLEVHMVHRGILDETQLAVIALMFQVSLGDSDPIISGLSSHLAKITQPGTKTTIADGLDFSSVAALLKTSDILQYTGSLTTPPCSEGVMFLVVKEPLPISVQDFNDIKSVVKFNSRFTQNTLGEANILEIGCAAGT